MKQLTKQLLALAIGAVALASTLGAFAEDVRPCAMTMPKPGEAHTWLQQMVGEWKSETTTYMPGQDPVKSTATETVSALGGFWVMDTVEGTMMNAPFKGVQTLGYDAKTGKYVGTWVDSMTGKLWTYEGTLDKESNTLTLESEGECPMRPGVTTRFKETVVMKDKNHKIYTSQVQMEDGSWMTNMVADARRVEDSDTAAEDEIEAESEE